MLTHQKRIYSINVSFIKYLLFSQTYYQGFYSATNMISVLTSFTWFRIIIQFEGLSCVQSRLRSAVYLLIFLFCVFNCGIYSNVTDYSFMCLARTVQPLHYKSLYVFMMCDWMQRKKVVLQVVLQDQNYGNDLHQMFKKFLPHLHSLGIIIFF